MHDTGKAGPRHAPPEHRAARLSGKPVALARGGGACGSPRPAAGASLRGRRPPRHALGQEGPGLADVVDDVVAVAPDAVGRTVFGQAPVVHAVADVSTT